MAQGENQHIETGTIDLSSVTSGRYISSSPIDVYLTAPNGLFNLFTTITGDPGVTGSGVSVIWDGSYASSGTTWVIPMDTSFIRDSGTSVNGYWSNGSDSATFFPDIFPFIRLKARHNGATTSTAKVEWALITN